MAYGKHCPYCGASLDPGEHCDCDGHEAPELEEAQKPHRQGPAVTDSDYYDREMRRRYRAWLMQ